MGNMIRCQEGHFFDREKHQSCPWCEPGGSGAKEMGKTEKLDVPPPAPVPDPSFREQGKTRLLDQTSQGIRPVVGWLVAIQGPEKGRDYRLHAEKNFIGREPSMDVCLKDAAVSRQRHAVVTFEPKKQVFYLQPGDAQGLVYLNGDLVNVPVEIEPYQVLEIGESKLALVPFDQNRVSGSAS